MVTRFLMKLFRSSNIDIINDCRLYFIFPLPSEIIEKRREKFLCKFKHCDSIVRHFGICGLCGLLVKSKLADVSVLSSTDVDFIIDTLCVS